MISADWTKLVDKILPESDGEDVVRMRTGVIDAVNSDGTVDVIISGLVVPNKRIIAYTKTDVGDNVQIMSYRGMLIVLGAVATESPIWQTFTPQIISTGSPTLGNATVIYRWKRIGKTVHVNAHLTLGSTTNVGTGNMIITLPVNAVGVNPSHVGTFFLIDASGSGASSRAQGVVELDQAGRFIMVLTNGNIVGASQPWTWATSDQIRFNLTYEAA